MLSIEPKSWPRKPTLIVLAIEKIQPLPGILLYDLIATSYEEFLYMYTTNLRCSALCCLNHSVAVSGGW